ncbi:MAG: PorV/PorQ family protein [bacterium]
MRRFVTKNRLTARIALVFSLALLMELMPQNLSGQIRSGGAFLKMLPGARQHGLAGSLTGAIDEMHAFYANPGATGFLREWQLSTSYTEWIADIYNLSIIYGRRLPLPWSDQSKVAFGFYYQGIREFDSTDQLQAPAAASDMVLTFSTGHPLSAISENLALGMNLKYFQSKLAGYSDRSWILDLGLLYRSNRFNLKNDFIQYGVFSMGLSVTQMGEPLTFVSDETPLPRTLRAGAALNLGTHNGLQIQFTADYQKVLDEVGRFSFGTEIFWSYRMALRGGYNFNNHALSKLSLGLSFRLDDHSLPMKNVLPGRNKALRLDVASLENNDFFSASFQGGVNYYPIAPENFEFKNLSRGTYTEVETDSIKLVWQAAPDPDLYDDVNYLLLIEKAEASLDRSQQIDKIIKAVDDPAGELFQTIEKHRDENLRIIDSGFAIDEKQKLVSITLAQLNVGDYFWSVIAYDKDQHTRFADKNGERIAHFRILPDLIITDIEFRPDKWITEDNYQGELLITVANLSNTRSSKNVLQVFDTTLEDHRQLSNLNNGHNGTDKFMTALEPVPIADLAAGMDTTVILKWYTTAHGKHEISAKIDKQNRLHEKNELNNKFRAAFYTIPKGVFKTKKEVVAEIDTVYEYELPFIPKIFFKHGSAKIETIKSTLMYSPLEVLVKRLQQNPGIHIKLRGYTDATNGEPAELAYERAKAVKSYFIEAGISEHQIEIPQQLTSEQIITNLNPKSQPDRTWVKNERRFVKITLHKQSDHTEEVADLFHSVPLTLTKSKTFLPVHFVSNIVSAVPLTSGTAQIKADSLYAEIPDVRFNTPAADSILWQHAQGDASPWTGKNILYFLVVKDSLNRVFYTPEKMATFASKKLNLLPRKIIVGVAEFKKDVPASDLYWLNVLDKVKSRLDDFKDIRLQFIGHACAIGSPAVNKTLSLNRAKKFQKEFLFEINNRDPEMLKRIEVRLDKYDGHGEQEPFQFEIDKESFLEVLMNKNFVEYQVIKDQIESGFKTIRFDPFKLRVKGRKVLLISDNATTYGRQINRRIEIHIKKVANKKFTAKDSPQFE